MKTVDMIQPYGRIIPMIYAYTTPGVSYHEGWTKIGYTEKQKVEDRIRQQTHTADIQVKLLWRDNAIYKDGSGESFTDHDFHEYLERYKIVSRRRNGSTSTARNPKIISMNLPKETLR